MSRDTSSFPTCPQNPGALTVHASAPFRRWEWSLWTSAGWMHAWQPGREPRRTISQGRGSQLGLSSLRRVSLRVPEATGGLQPDLRCRLPCAPVGLVHLHHEGPSLVHLAETILPSLSPRQVRRVESSAALEEVTTKSTQLVEASLVLD